MATGFFYLIIIEKFETKKDFKIFDFLYIQIKCIFNRLSSNWPGQISGRISSFRQVYRPDIRQNRYPVQPYLLYLPLEPILLPLLLLLLQLHLGQFGPLRPGRTNPTSHIAFGAEQSFWDSSFGAKKSFQASTFGAEMSVKDQVLAPKKQ